MARTVAARGGGVSGAGAIKAEGVIGCRSHWLATGEGDMLATPAAQSTAAPTSSTEPPDLAAAPPVVLAALRRLPRQQRQAQRADR
jgi:hypothetical protein